MTIGKIPTPLTELNFDLVWNRVPDYAKMAFIGVPQKVKLASGFELYKFTESKFMKPFITKQGKITEWWSPVHPCGIDPGLSARIHLAKHLGASPGDLTRVVAAVRRDWNALTHVLQARLLMTVYGFWGQCNWQPRNPPRGDDQPPRAGIPAPQARGDMPEKWEPGWPGKAWQFYIPNLTSAHVMEVRRYPI